MHKRAFAFYGLDELTHGEKGVIPYHEEYSQVPMVSYIIFVFWKIFGINLWLPRLAMICFMTGSIILLYYIVKQLTNNEYLSLLSSFFLSFMPLGIYFGRNIQPESPALFFILLGSLLYLKWTEILKLKFAFWSMLAVGIAGCFKATYLIILVPFVFVFPYYKILAMLREKRKNFFYSALYGFLGFLPCIFLNLLFEVTMLDASKSNYSVDLFRVFGSEYWITRIPAIKSYIADNYTWWFFWFAFVGIIFAAVKYKTKFARFMIGYLLAFVPYVMIISSKFAGHSYYQMPFLPLVCISAAYFFYTCGLLLKRITKIKILQFAPLIILLFAIGSVQAANNRVWDTNFYGQDVIGEYIQKQTEWGDRIIAFTHSQGMAVCSYAKRSCGGAGNLTDFKYKEKVFNIDFVYIDMSQFNNFKNNNEMFEYISGNYKIDLIGLIKQEDKFAPIQMLLKKGGKFNMSEIETRRPLLKKTYDIKRGKIEYYWIKND
ncbi:glycosyltransferase family 39 protein [Candidatus Woesearchaeota archaeon]|nr:glycosyltransferase family 39 protein [Candidatus Woesearchaeota archaeon]